LCFPESGKFVLFGDNSSLIEGSSSGIVNKVKTRFQNGTLSEPSLTMDSDTSSGFYKHALNSYTWSYSANGTEVLQIGPNYIRAINYGFLGKQAYAVGSGTTLVFLGANYPGIKYITDPLSSAITTLTLPNANTLSDGFFIYVLASSSYGIRVTPNLANRIIIGALPGGLGQSILASHEGATTKLFLYNSKWYTQDMQGTFVFS
jgi:hypothetical protein